MLKETSTEEIDYTTAKKFIETWHYSGVVPKGKNLFFGWFVSGVLYAVINYGIGVNPHQAKFLSKATGYDVSNENLLELKRLCRIEPKNINMPLTYFIAKCNKLVKQTAGCRYVVSFSDPAHNHNGGVYKAANFTHLGKTNKEVHTIDSSGVVRHRRYYYRFAKRNNMSMEDARIALGLKKLKTIEKDRWFIKL